VGPLAVRSLVGPLASGREKTNRQDAKSAKKKERFHRKGGRTEEDQLIDPSDLPPFLFPPSLFFLAFLASWRFKSLEAGARGGLREAGA
jgi:hypothetical protein